MILQFSFPAFLAISCKISVWPTGTYFLMLSSVSLFFPTPFDLKLKILDVLNHMPSQATQIYYQAVYKSWHLIAQTRHLSKSWVFKSHFPFKVGQHIKQQLYLQYKVCGTLYNMVGALSISQLYLFIQPHVQSPPKIFFS